MQIFSVRVIIKLYMQKHGDILHLYIRPLFLRKTGRLRLRTASVQRPELSSLVRRNTKSGKECEKRKKSHCFGRR